MFAYPNQMPGVTASIQSVENTFEWGPQTPWMSVGVQLLSTAVDAGSTPTTVLRRGLVLGKVTATGLYREYLPANTDGSQFPVGILNDNVDMYDARAGAVANRLAQMRIGGLVKPASLYGFDENARVMLSSRFTWDDLRQEVSLDRVVAKTAGYTVLSTDNHTVFTTEGAAGAVVFTLPTPARGYRFRFLNAVNQNMTVAAPAGLLIAFNNAAATSIAFSTAGNMIGAGVEVTVTADGTKYIAQVLTTATATIA